LFVPCHRAIAERCHGNNVINVALLLDVHGISYNFLGKRKEREE
jgi:hypothetical protein